MPKAKFSCSLCTWLHFHLLCPDSCYLQVCFDMPTAVPAVFLFTSELAFKSYKTLMHVACRRGMQEITLIYKGGIFCYHVSTCFITGIFKKIPKYVKNINKVTPHVAFLTCSPCPKKPLLQCFYVPATTALHSHSVTPRRM